MFFFFHFQRLFVVKQALVTGHFTLNLYWPLMRTILESGPEVSAYERLFYFAEENDNDIGNDNDDDDDDNYIGMTAYNY